MQIFFFLSWRFDPVWETRSDKRTISIKVQLVAFYAVSHVKRCHDIKGRLAAKKSNEWQNKKVWRETSCGKKLDVNLFLNALMTEISANKIVFQAPFVSAWVWSAQR